MDDAARPRRTTTRCWRFTSRLKQGRMGNATGARSRYDGRARAGQVRCLAPRAKRLAREQTTADCVKLGRPSTPARPRPPETADHRGQIDRVRRDALFANCAPLQLARRAGPTGACQRSPPGRNCIAHGAKADALYLTRCRRRGTCHRERPAPGIADPTLRRRSRYRPEDLPRDRHRPDAGAGAAPTARSPGRTRAGVAGDARADKPSERRGPIAGTEAGGGPACCAGPAQGTGGMAGGAAGAAPALLCRRARPA